MHFEPSRHATGWSTGGGLKYVSKNERIIANKQAKHRETKKRSIKDQSSNKIAARHVKLPGNPKTSA